LAGQHFGFSGKVSAELRFGLFECDSGHVKNAVGEIAQR
jgi:hypothetical protein